MGSKDSGMGSSQEGANLAENLKESERSWKTLPFSLLSKPSRCTGGGGGKCFVIVCVYCTVFTLAVSLDYCLEIGSYICMHVSL